jgi:hypothetical protein
MFMFCYIGVVETTDQSGRAGIEWIYRPFKNYFRPRRMRLFATSFDIKNDTRIIDLGGTPFNWSLIEQRPHVTMVNMESGHEVAASYKELDASRHEMVIYDGQIVPFPDRSFDICYSNSVIEHVGDDCSVALFASEVRRLAPRYFVQTPNRWFFVEPHFITPFVHWLPLVLKRKLIRWCSVWGWVNKADQATVDQFLRDIRLLTVKEMRHLFPDAEIVREYFLGFTKSIIAMKR